MFVCVLIVDCSLLFVLCCLSCFFVCSRLLVGGLLLFVGWCPMFAARVCVLTVYCCFCYCLLLCVCDISLLLVCCSLCVV